MSESLTLPEALALLLLDPGGRLLATGQAFDAGLAGAALGDLALRGQVSLERKRVVVAKAPPTGNSAVDGFVHFLEAAPSPRRPTSWVSRLGNRGLRDAVLGGLVHREVLAREERRVLGIFPSVRWPERDGGPEKALRAELWAVLQGQAAPTPFTTALIGLLQATRSLRTQFGPQDRARVRWITQGDWIAEAVRFVIRQAESSVGGIDGVDGGGGDGGGGGGDGGSS